MSDKIFVKLHIIGEKKNEACNKGAWISNKYKDFFKKGSYMTVVPKEKNILQDKAPTQHYKIIHTEHVLHKDKIGLCLLAIEKKDTKTLPEYFQDIFARIFIKKIIKGFLNDFFKEMKENIK